MNCVRQFVSVQHFGHTEVSVVKSSQLHSIMQLSSFDESSRQDNMKVTFCSSLHKEVGRGRNMGLFYKQIDGRSVSCPLRLRAQKFHDCVVKSSQVHNIMQLSSFD